MQLLLFFSCYLTVAFGIHFGEISKDNQINDLLERPFNIIPLGSGCALALYLNEYGLRHASYPLDWVDLPCVSALYEILECDFKDFMDFSYLRIVKSKKDRRSRLFHTKYDIQIPHILKIRDWLNTSDGLRPKKSENISLLNDIVTMFDRRIARFYEIVKHSNLLYFVRLGINEDEAVNLYKMLKRKFPESNFRLVCLVKEFKYAWSCHEGIIVKEIKPVHNPRLSVVKQQYLKLEKVFKEIGWLE